MLFRDTAIAIAIATAVGTAAPPALAAEKKEKAKEGAPAPVASIDDIDVTGAWLRAARAGENAYIFLTVKNKGDVPVKLKPREVDIARATRIVKFRVRGPMLHPSMVGPVPVEGHETFSFEPGVAAIELQEIHRDLKKGETLPLTVAFGKAGEIEVEAEVDSRTAVRYPEPSEEGGDGKKE